MVGAPQRKVARMTGLLCAYPVTYVEAMGAVRATGLFWVAVLKRDPMPPVGTEHYASLRARGLFPELMRCPAPSVIPLCGGSAGSFTFRRAQFPLIILSSGPMTRLRIPP
jgi:hypothetical protein